MRRPARRLFALCSAASLLLCAAVCVLWVRSYVGGDSASRLGGGHRYTLRSEQGRIALMRPPGAADGLDRRMARPTLDAPRPGERGARGSVDALTQRISNDQIVWEGIRVTSGPQRGQLLEAYPSPSDAAAELWPPHSHEAAQLVPALLAALEQPDKFAVAHFLLGMNLKDPRSGLGGRMQQQSAGSVRVTLDGLTFVVRAVGEGSQDASPLGDDEEVVGAASSVDAAELPAIRELWHRRLDVPALAAPHWLFVSVLLTASIGLVAPSVYRRFHGSAFAGARRCSNCGYDLRATPGRCPECGTGAAPAESAAAPPG